MTDDQHRIGQTTKAEIYLAGILERFAGLQPDQRPDPARIAAAAVQKLQGYGWRLPAALEDPPPPRGEKQLDGPGKRAFDEARAALAAKRSQP